MAARNIEWKETCIFVRSMHESYAERAELVYYFLTDPIRYCKSQTQGVRDAV